MRSQFTLLVMDEILLHNVDGVLDGARQNMFHLTQLP